MAAIPWKTIADVTLPHLIDQAAKLFRKADASTQKASDVALVESTAEQKLALLAQQIEQLEEVGAEQARLVQQSLEEIQKITVLAAGIQARANAAVFVSALAVLCSILLWVFVR